CVSFSPDGKRIVTGGNDNLLKIWDAETGQETLTLRAHTALVQCVAWSPDGARIASSSTDGTIRLWEASDKYGKPTEQAQVRHP
ncbi:MAG TPA: hypothetical protein VEI07_20075, partial [Planctomycetaceae bacterium]|nr:hypothetical protein [Planctomycetaceae bacterium]